MFFGAATETMVHELDMPPKPMNRARHMAATARSLLSTSAATPVNSTMPVRPIAAGYSRIPA